MTRPEFELELLKADLAWQRVYRRLAILVGVLLALLLLVQAAMAGGVPVWAPGGGSVAVWAPRCIAGVCGRMLVDGSGGRALGPFIPNPPPQPQPVPTGRPSDPAMWYLLQTCPSCAVLDEPVGDE